MTLPQDDTTAPNPAIGWVVFDNPTRHNAMSLRLWQMAAAHITAYETDPTIRAVIMRGAGDQAFVSGADISEFDSVRDNAAQAQQYSVISNQARHAMSELSKPLIAMIHGYCFGAGVDIALRADIRIASDSAVFCVPAAKLGIAYAQESVQLLVDLVGPSVAKDMLFSGRRIKAQEALQLGLVNQVVPANELEAVTQTYARTLSDNAPLTIKAAKFAVRQSLIGTDQQDPHQSERLIADCFDSADYKEGRTAFKEKRKPSFRGV